MGFYQDQVVPLLTSLSMRNKNLAAYRERVVPEATGRVLEIGIGSGLNLPLYSPKTVQQVIGLEPSPKLLEMAGHGEFTTHIWRQWRYRKAISPLRPMRYGHNSFLVVRARERAMPGAGRCLWHATARAETALSMPGCPKPSKVNSPTSPKASPSCWRVTALKLGRSRRPRTCGAKPDKGHWREPRFLKGQSSSDGR